MKPSITEFWGKARPSNQAGPDCHSIVYHSLDVVAVGSELAARDRERLTRMAAAVGIEIGALKSALPFFLALHDIGKYSRVFQAKSPDHWPVNSLGPYRQVAPGNSHVITGFQMLVRLSDDGPSGEIFDTVMPEWTASERKILFRAIAGHHGKPPAESVRSALGRDDVCESCLAAAHEHVRAVYALLRPEALPRRPARDMTILAVVRKAVEWCVRAGKQSLRRLSAEETISQLRRGLALLEKCPDDEWTCRSELTLCLLIGKAQLAARTHADQGATATFARARALCERLRDPPELLSVLFAQCFRSFVRAEHATALQLAEEVLALGNNRNDRAWTAAGCFTIGMTSIPIGNLAAARSHLERGITLYDAAQRDACARPFIGDPLVIMRTYLSAYALTPLGRIDEARRMSEQVVADALQMDQMWSLDLRSVEPRFHGLHAGIARRGAEPLGRGEHARQKLRLRALRGAVHDGAGMVPGGARRGPRGAHAGPPRSRCPPPHRVPAAGADLHPE